MDGTDGTLSRVHAKQLEGKGRRRKRVRRRRARPAERRARVKDVQAKVAGRDSKVEEVKQRIKEKKARVIGAGDTGVPPTKRMALETQTKTHGRRHEQLPGGIGTLRFYLHNEA